jgi:hypothetical protein
MARKAPVRHLSPAEIKRLRPLEAKIADAFAEFNASAHLAAHRYTNDPWHIVRGYLAWREISRRAPPAALLRALDAALGAIVESHARPSRAVSDIELNRYVRALQRDRSDGKKTFPALSNGRAIELAARESGMSVGQVKMRLSRLRATLRKGSPDEPAHSTWVHGGRRARK